MPPVRLRQAMPGGPWRRLEGKGRTRLKIHLLGIGGTLMANLAVLLRQAGHQVRGSDGALYSPMRELLAASGIDVARGQQVRDLGGAADLFVIANALSRGHEQVEHILRRRLPYASAPEALRRFVLGRRPVWAVSGTHGKTTTTALLAHLLKADGPAGGAAEAPDRLRADGPAEASDEAPGWLVAGQPQPPLEAARLGGGDGPFAIEADEYDCAFFDKSAKFLHYRPQRAIVTGIEYDHADIYPDLDAIVAQFHRMVRAIPDNGCLVAPLGDPQVERMLEMGCWTQVRRFGLEGDAALCDDREPAVLARSLAPDWGRFALECRVPGGAATPLGEVRWGLRGAYNARNAAAALALLLDESGPEALRPLCAKLGKFAGLARRQQLLRDPQDSGGVEVYSDFAHHPTSVAAVLEALAPPPPGRLLALLELRSNSMAGGVHGDAVALALKGADLAWVRHRTDLGQSYEIRSGMRAAASWRDEAGLAAQMAGQARPGDRLVLMSNGALEGFAARVLDLLAGA